MGKSRLPIVSLCLVALSSVVTSAPLTSSSSTSGSPSPSPTLPYASDNPNVELWNQDSYIIPEPIRGSLGATILGPTNVLLDLQNPSLLAPPSTDHGTIPNAKWPFYLSHNRLQTGGWSRQQNVNDMPISIEMAGVDMRLEAGSIRELHWHTTAEWAYVLKGTTQITTVTPDGQNYLANVNQGDIWYFPPGQPHSLQATADCPEGTEFLLVFDNGKFSEDSTFLLTDWLAHIPKEVIAKNFQVDQSAFDHIPDQELYIFPSTPPSDNGDLPISPQGQSSEPYSFPLSQYNATQLPGGTIKIVDSTVFKASKTIAVAEITLEPGAMRELHWHPIQAEWDYFISGNARITLFAANSDARTFDYQPGDIAYIPQSYGHYVENTGNTTLHYLEIMKTDKFQDVSLNQWLALTPPAIVKAHLDVSDDTISHFSKTKPIIVG
ncbi:oxalate decarboxylase [Laetiporus sulphureus 93-53]|uniref:Oxalate decarboxylase n=1 Tax=Laetiporus sulphureus 93-53 TaxID=1314785 RepID=A0A165CCD7_9APHY|nr:oxalate decarboxylase [Laetiporus sulphureus 93-53]KZT02556.1 oxalate decarboxylase [Laetiporus sulphureus 93-53]